MSQSSTIAGFLLVGFLVYITITGELSQYKSILFGSSPSSSTGSSASSSSLDTILGALPDLLP